MFGLTTVETYLAAALALVMGGSGITLSFMTDAHMTRRDQRRRARISARAKARRERGQTVRPRRYGAHGGD